MLSDTDWERCSIELARSLNFYPVPPYVYSSKSRSLTDEVDVRPLKFRETLFSSGSSGIEVCWAISCYEFYVS